MKRFALVVSICVGAITMNAQDAILIDPVTSHTFDSQKYVEINGTPFLVDQWITGSVKVPRGIYKDQRLKFDVYNNTLLFQKDDKPYEFYEPVQEFILMPRPADSSSYMRFVNGISASGLKPEQYVQVLASGKLSFYRSDIKLVSDMNEINKGIVKTFNNSTRYYFKNEAQTQIMKLSQKEILALMEDKKTQIDEYVSKNKPSFKKEKEVAELVKYYNSL